MPPIRFQNEAYTSDSRHKQRWRSVRSNPKATSFLARKLTHATRGLEADQKVIAAHGCYAMTAQAALTAQNTLGVRRIHEVPSEFVREQIDAVVEDLGVDVVKTGKCSWLYDSVQQ